MGTMFKEPLKFGLITMCPYLAIKNNQIVGTLSATLKNIHYFVLRPFNVTPISIPSELSSCNEDGYCSGHIGDLQSGQYDYFDYFNEYQISSKMINITIGPRIRGVNCNIMHRSVIQNNLEYSSALTILTAFDLKFWLFMFLATFGLLFLLSKLKPNISILGWFKILVEYSIGQRYQKIPSWRQKLCLLVFVITTILNGKLFSGLLQTGFTKSIKFSSVDSFKDVIEQKLKVIVLQATICHNLIMSSPYPQAVTIAKSLSTINAITDWHGKIVEAFLDSGNVLIHDELLLSRFISFFCFIEPLKVYCREIYISKKPLLTAHEFLLLNSHLNSKSLKKIIKYAYAAYETGNLQNSKILQLDAESMAQTSVSFNSLRLLELDKQSVITAINLSYFKPIMVIWLSILCLCSALLLLDYFRLKQSKEKIFKRKNLSTRFT